MTVPGCSTTDVAIVGGGFCGISLARLLADRGIGVTVLERGGRIGRKTRTLLLDENDIEMGTCYIALDYGTVLALGRRYGMATRPLGRATANPASVLAPLFASSSRGMLQRVRLGMTALRNLPRYTRRRAAVLRQFAAGDPATMRALGGSVQAWLKAERLGALRGVFAAIGTGFGYGVLESVPALYMLRWMSTAMILTLLMERGRMFKPGYGALLGGMAEGLDLRLGCEAGAMAFDEAAGLWTVAAQGGDVSARHLVIACPPVTPALRAPFEPERRHVLENASPCPYCTVLVTARGWFTSHRRVFARAGEQQDYMLGARNDGNCPEGAYYMCAIIPTSYARDHLEAILRRDIAADGGTLGRIVEVGDWHDYAFQVRGAAIADGRYHALEAAQGARNLWLSNAVLAHENWRDLLVLNKRIAAAIEVHVAPPPTAAR